MLHGNKNRSVMNFFAKICSAFIVFFVVFISGCDAWFDHRCEVDLEGAIEVVVPLPDTLRFPLDGSMQYLTTSQYFSVREGVSVDYGNHRWKTDAIITQAVRQDTIWFLASRPAVTTVAVSASHTACEGAFTRGVTVPVIVD